jgi:hypothetical protein
MIKKYLSILAVTAVATAASFGQGTLVFANSSTTLVRFDNNGTITNVPTSGGSVEFFYAPVGTQGPASNLDLNPAGWTFLDGTTRVISPAGRFNAGTYTVPAIAPGSTVAGLVRGWTGVFANYQAAVAGGAYIGYSSVFTVDTGDPTTVPPGTAAGITSSTATPFTGIVLTAVPEPSSMALAGLGAASLLIFRRRK